MRTTYKKAFAQFVKKASKPLQLTIEIKVVEVCSNPMLGQQKQGASREFLFINFDLIHQNI